LPRIFDKLGRFGAAHPVRNFDLFEVHVQSQLAQLGGDIVDRSLSLQRAAGTRPDVLGQMRYLAIGIIVGQCGFLDGGKLLQQLPRKVLLFCLRSLRLRTKTDGRILRRRVLTVSRVWE
jgi:hypothetical protein